MWHTAHPDFQLTYVHQLCCGDHLIEMSGLENLDYIRAHENNDWAKVWDGEIPRWGLGVGAAVKLGTWAERPPRAADSLSDKEMGMPGFGSPCPTNDVRRGRFWKVE
jgi:hypothetical protein